MYAIIEIGGRQYRVEKNSEFLTNRVLGKATSIVKFKKVLFGKDKASYAVGTPYLKDAYVSCEILEHPRAKKVVAFKYKRRKSSKKKVGHRQDLTKLRVKEIKLS